MVILSCAPTANSTYYATLTKAKPVFCPRIRISKSSDPDIRYNRVFLVHRCIYIYIYGMLEQSAYISSLIIWLHFSIAQDANLAMTWSDHSVIDTERHCNTGEVHYFVTQHFLAPGEISSDLYHAWHGNALFLGSNYPKILFPTNNYLVIVHNKHVGQAPTLSWGSWNGFQFFSMSQSNLLSFF